MNSLNNDKLPLKFILNDDLLNRLPGIFYLYEIIDNVAYLKGWNNNHVKVTGYSPEEMLNKDVLSFIAEDSKAAIVEAISTLLEEGSVKQIYGNLCSKTGEITPFVFEGHRFYVEQRIYFMGVGLDVSDLVKAEQDSKLHRFQKLQKERELLSIGIQEQKREALLKKVLLKLEELETKVSNKSNVKAINALTKEIKTQFSFNDHWQVFKNLFKEIHYDFFMVLNQKHPSLTKGELQYCAYLKIQMSSTEICKVMNISKEGITKKRYRLKKKLGLSKTESLDLYVNSI